MFSGVFKDRFFNVDDSTNQRINHIPSSPVVYAISGLCQDVESGASLYIGSAFNADRRIKNHFRELRRSNHDNPHLQNSYNLYGESNYVIWILEHSTFEEVIDREQNWLDFYNARYSEAALYNVLQDVLIPPCLNGASNPIYGTKRPEYVRQAIIESNKRRVWTDAQRERAKKLGKQSACIEALKRGNATQSKTYELINPEGERIKITNMSQFAREQGIDPSSLIKVARGKLKSSKGYRRAL